MKERFRRCSPKEWWRDSGASFVSSLPRDVTQATPSLLELDAVAFATNVGVCMKPSTEDPKTVKDKSIKGAVNLLLVGLSYKTAPVEVREQLAFSENSLAAALQRLKKEFGLQEGMIVSTCNRVEVIASSPTQADGLERIKHFLYSYHALQPPTLEDCLYSYSNRDVINHVFRVTSSLDSMVLGESQILAQVKRSFATACEVGSVGTSLNRLIRRAFFVAKRVRTETRIAHSAVSVSYVAVELARRIFGDLHDRSILLLGAGKMSELAVRSLVASGISRIFVANRTVATADQLAAKLGGKAVSFERLDHYLHRVDIALVSTGSKSFILEKKQLQKVIRKRKYNPLFIIDISVPRNVHPDVNEIENVFVYDIDDLQSISQANIQERQREAETAEEIVSEEVENYLTSLSSNHMGPLISALRTRLEEICLEELKKTRNRLKEDEYRRLERLLRKTAHKIAHPLILEMKHLDQNSTGSCHPLEMLKKAFRLDEK